MSSLKWFKYLNIHMLYSNLYYSSSESTDDSSSEFTDEDVVKLAPTTPDWYYISNYLASLFGILNACPS